MLQTDSVIYSLVALGIGIFGLVVYGDYRTQLKKQFIEGGGIEKDDVDDDDYENDSEEEDSENDSGQEGEDQNSDDEAPPLVERTGPSGRTSSQPLPQKKQAPSGSSLPLKTSGSSSADKEIDFYPFVLATLRSANFAAEDSGQNVKLSGALDILKTKSTFGEHQQKMRERGLIPLLTKIVKETPASMIATKAAFTLGNLSLIPSNDVEFSREKVLKVLFERSEEIPFLAADALQTLLNLSSRESIPHQDMAEAKVVERTLKILKDNRISQQRLHVSALDVLFNLSFHQIQRRAMVRLGAIEAVESNMSSPNVKLSDPAKKLFNLLTEEKEKMANEPEEPEPEVQPAEAVAGHADDDEPPVPMPTEISPAADENIYAVLEDIDSDADFSDTEETKEPPVEETRQHTEETHTEENQAVERPTEQPVSAVEERIEISEVERPAASAEATPQEISAEEASTERAAEESSKEPEGSQQVDEIEPRQEQTESNNFEDAQSQDY